MVCQFDESFVHKSNTTSVTIQYAIMLHALHVEADSQGLMYWHWFKNYRLFFIKENKIEKRNCKTENTKRTQTLKTKSICDRKRVLRS